LISELPSGNFIDIPQVVKYAVDFQDYRVSTTPVKPMQVSTTVTEKANQASIACRLAYKLKKGLPHLNALARKLKK